MSKLRVKLKSHSYDIFFLRSEMTQVCQKIKSLVVDNTIFLITDTRIKRLYGKKWQNTLSRSFRVHWIVIPDGETQKNLKTCETIWTRLSELGCHRQSCLVALGGGVVGDITGFVAATYMRGISFIQIPTTLLAMVDSSVGGKTGVDLKTGKNLVGAFHQPKAVFILTDFLQTLPAAEFRSGMAEVIKYALIGDKALFTLLMKKSVAIKNQDHTILDRVIRRCVAIKATIVEKDEKEASLRAILNYGHTLGHAVETLSRYKIKHGDAVAMGMVFAAHLSHAKRHSTQNLITPTVNLLTLYGLPITLPPFSPSAYLKAINKDKKAQGSTIKFILAQKIGRVDIVNIPKTEIIPWLKNKN
jgi:3-dehydroquinate synthase